VQGDRSVDEYFQEMEMCLLHIGIIEDEGSTMARFLVGINKPIANKVDMTSYTNLIELVHFAKRAERQLADSYNKRRVSFSTNNSNTPWRNQQQQGSGSRTPSSRAPFTPHSVSTPTKQTEVKGKAVGSSQSSPSIAPTKKKTSKIECFKCGGHGHKQAECPNRRVILTLADGSYYSQCEEEDGNHDTFLHEDNLETFEYEAEDGECELGLNCLALKPIHYVGEQHMMQPIVSRLTKEITCADFDDLLADFDDLDTHISPREDSLSEPATDPSKSTFITLLAAPCHNFSSQQGTTLDAATYQVVPEVICAPESGPELPLFLLAYDKSNNSKPNYHSLQPEYLSSNFGSLHHSLVLRVLSTQFVAAEQGQRHSLFQSQCKIKGQVCRFIIDGGSCNNTVSAMLVEKLGLQTRRHPHPYDMQ
jgi:hypothetical protein